jgi:hypothetical protein
MSAGLLGCADCDPSGFGVDLCSSPSSAASAVPMWTRDGAETFRRGPTMQPSLLL